MHYKDEYLYTSCCETHSRCISFALQWAILMLSPSGVKLRGGGEAIVYRLAGAHEARCGRAAAWDRDRN